MPPWTTLSTPSPRSFERYEDVLDVEYAEALPLILDDEVADALDEESDDDEDEDDLDDDDDSDDEELDAHAVEDEDDMDDDIEAFDLR